MFFGLVQAPVGLESLTGSQPLHLWKPIIIRSPSTIWEISKDNIGTIMLGLYRGSDF